MVFCSLQTVVRFDFVLRDRCWSCVCGVWPLRKPVALSFDFYSTAVAAAAITFRLRWYQFVAGGCASGVVVGLDLCYTCVYLRVGMHLSNIRPRKRKVTYSTDIRSLNMSAPLLCSVLARVQFPSPSCSSSRGYTHPEIYVAILSLPVR